MLKAKIMMIISVLIFLYASMSYAGPGINAVMVDVPPVIDGILDDSCWKKAAKIDDFRVLEKEGAPASEKTIAFICYDQKNIYVAFEAFNSNSAKITAFQKKRGGSLDLDDWVSVSFDTFRPYRGEGYSFKVNPLGTQWEWIPQGSATNITWRGDWKASADIRKDRWSAEMAIPFGILRYPKNTSSFGIKFSRYIASKRELSSFVATREPDENAKWVGLHLPIVGYLPIFLPYVLAGLEDKERSIDFGIDMKWRPTSFSTALITVMPDFQNVEQEVESIDFSYTERFLSDRRPFFAEGGGFSPASEAFYSRRIKEIDFGTKFFGRFGKYSVGVLDTLNIKKKNDLALNLKRDIGKLSNVSLSLVDARGDNIENTVLGGSLKWGFSSFNNATVSFYKSQTKRIGGDGTFLKLHLFKWGLPGEIGYMLSLSDVNFEYNPVDAFIPEKGLRKGTVWTRYGKKPETGFLEEWYVENSANLALDYSRELRYWHLAPSITTRLRNDIQLQLGTSVSRRPPYHDRVLSLEAKHSVNDFYRQGGINLKIGRLAGSDYRYIYLFQGVKLGVGFSFKISWEYMKMNKNVEEEVQRQGTLHVNYDISPERSFGTRVIRSNKGTNFFLTYRQALRRGLDAFVIVGEPNSTSFTKKLLFKLILPF